MTAPTLFLREQMDEVRTVPVAGGVAAVLSARGPNKSLHNEDAAAVAPLPDGRGLLVVADGVGGQPAGADAARAAVEALVETVGAGAGRLREAVLDGFERANEAVQAIGVGAAATLVAATLDGERVRLYHAGDAIGLSCDERGQVGAYTVSHSPIGFAFESGLLSEDEALSHDARHLVSNVVGSPEMSIEVGPSRRLRPGESLLLASDGLVDNLRLAEVLQRLRGASPAESARALAAAARERMTTPTPGQPSKPDDLTLVVFRRDEGS